MTTPTLLLLLSLFAQPPAPALPLPKLFPVPQLFQFQYEPDEPVDVKPTVQVLYDDSPRSKLMVSELTRDWTAPRIPVSLETLTLLTQLNAVRDGIKPHLVLVDVSQDPLFRYRKDLPLWRMRERGEPQRFDDRTFGTSSWPLLTVDSIVFEATVDLTAWRRECRNQYFQARSDYFNEISAWVSKIAPAEIATFSRDYCNEHEEGMSNLTSDDLVAEYGSWDGFPPFTWQPPPKPSKPFPWEPACPRSNSSPTTR